MSRRATRTYRLPEPADIHRDDVVEFVEKLGHDPRKVLRMRIGPRDIQVDLLPPRRDVAKLTVVHPIIGGDEE